MSALFCLTTIGNSPVSSCELQRRRSANVALAIGAVLEELPDLVARTARGPNLPRAFDHNHPRRFVADLPAVRDPAGNDHIVARLVRQVAQHRFQNARPLGNVNQFVPLGIAVEKRVGGRRLHVRHRHVGVKEQGAAIERGALLLRQAVRGEVPHPQGGIVIPGPFALLQEPRRDDGGGRTAVIEQRRGPENPRLPITCS